MVVWLITKKGAVKIEDRYKPSFYVHSANFDEVVKALRDLPEVDELKFAYRKTLGSNKARRVLKVTPSNLASLNRLASFVDSLGHRLFDVDIRLSTRYLRDRGIFCNAWVEWDGRRFLLKDEQWALDYPLPSFKTIHLDIEATFDKPITSITLGELLIKEENEIDTILSAVRYIRRIDPDIIYTRKGDSFSFPLLYHRATLHGYAINIGRDRTSLTPERQAKSYFSYGRIIYRPAFYTLKGRAHIDTSSFLYQESGFYGIIDISRCSCIPLQLLSRLSPGTAISQIQVNKAMEKGYLIPWRKSMPENWKSAMDLLVADRGGLVLEPFVGIHENVVELDFASLYPNIMLNFNISPETVLCKCCKSSSIRVPQLGYNICTKRKGIIPEVLKSILYRRFCFKARSKNEGYDRDLYAEMQKAWKWILLVCFGYTGYRNARYGRIECHESITAFSREILLTAMEIAEKAGYEVLHGIIDSLWIKGKGCINPSSLSRKISIRTGIRMDVEGIYRWIVFLPSRSNTGAVNRYYGLFENGELKVRGIELRQRSTPRFLKEMQHEMLNVFSSAYDSKGFLRLISTALEVLQKYAKRIRKGDVNLEDLLFTTHVSKKIEEYKVNNLVKSALLQLQDTGIYVQPGQSIQYIVREGERVKVVELLDGKEKIDTNFYLRQIVRCGESILLPFGYTFNKLEKYVK